MIKINKISITVKHFMQGENYSRVKHKMSQSTKGPNNSNIIGAITK